MSIPPVQNQPPGIIPQQSRSNPPSNTNTQESKSLFPQAKSIQQLCSPVIQGLPSATAEEMRARELRFGKIPEQPSSSFLRSKRGREPGVIEEDDQRKREPRLDPSLKSSPVPSELSVIRDRYTEARGEPKIVEINCGRCEERIMEYQKDGPGRLLRCYLDRIRTPQLLDEKKFTIDTVRHATDLKCSHCFQVFGKPFIYQRRFPNPEMRPAYKIVNPVQIIEKKCS
jgi:hypothetical protein